MIAASFEDALRCFEASLFTACAIMCRRTLEGICVRQGAVKGKLQAKIIWLKENDVIETRMAEWADELRLAGNDAAHEVEVVFSQEDAGDLLDFTRALAEYIFTFSAAFQQFKKRRSSATGSSGGTASKPDP